MKNLKDGYFRWMYDVVSDKTYFHHKDYIKLCDILNNIDYYYILSMDANRESDGISLRYRFGYEKGLPDTRIASELDNTPVSVLEIMVALAFRIEEDIVGSEDYGNRTGKWFYYMLDGLHLTSMYDSNPNFDIGYINSRIETWLAREFYPNGNESPFYIQDPKEDLRTVDLWTQAMWFITENER